METVPVVRMSSKGRVVIPEEIRERHRLKAGADFVIYEGKDSVTSKALTEPSVPDLDTFLREARREARRVGLKRSDITKAIAEVRAERRRSR